MDSSESTTAGVTRTHAIQLMAGLRVMTQTTSVRIRTPNTPSRARPLELPSYAAYSIRLISCAASRNAEGCRRARPGHRRNEKLLLFIPSIVSSDPNRKNNKSWQIVVYLQQVTVGDGGWTLYQAY